MAEGKGGRPVHGRLLGAELCRVLDLDVNKVRALQLECNVHDAATVEVRTFPTRDQADRLVEVVAQFDLVWPLTGWRARVHQWLLQREKKAAKP